MAFKGLFGGNPITIWNAPVDIVMQMFHYSAFMGKYNETSIMLNLNKGNKK